ncbi:MAG: Gfo/Idh/MocA family protein [Planctomycetota bacterium]
MQQAFRISIIGIHGHSGGYVIGQLPANPEVVVAAVTGADGNATDILEQCRRHGQQPQCCEDFDSLLQVPVDLVVLDGAWQDHARHCIRAMEAGCHVLVEKPAALDLDELAELRLVQARTGKQLLSMFGMRYQAPFFTAYRLLQEGRIGRPRLIHAQKSYKLGQRPEWYQSRARSGGLIPWIASHGIDLLHWFAGSAPVEVSASHSRQGNREHGEWEVSACCHFRFPGDLAGTVQADCLRSADASSHGDDRLRVVGTAGILEVRDGAVYLDDVEQTLQLTPGLLADVRSLCQQKAAGLLSTRQTLEVTESALRARASADQRAVEPCGVRSSTHRPTHPTSRPPGVLLVGLEGHGRSHAQTASSLESHHHCRIVGGVDPAHPTLADNHPLKQHPLPIYADLQEAISACDPDLVVLCTPIQLHAPLASIALQAGCSVLLEKPLCGSLQESRALIDLAASSPGFLAIGYQLCYDPGCRQLKEDILRGRFGAAKDFSVSVLWPRPCSYYQRNRWAGRIHSDDGLPVLDSPHNNACAHFLFQMLWLLGETEAGAAQVADVRAALGRAHAIENGDTTLLEMTTTTGVSLRFAASHAIDEEVHPRFRMEFEQGTILAGAGGGLCAHTPEGIIHYRGGPDRRLHTCLEALASRDSIPCSALAAARHTEVVIAAQQAGVVPAPEELVDRRDNGRVVVRGLAEQIAAVCDLQRLPDIPWLPLGAPVPVQSV